MDLGKKDVSFRFVPYGTVFEPRPNALVLDVGMKTLPGVIDHHHPEAAPECTASLIAKQPSLVLEHIPAETPGPLTIITHRLPDFDATASAFLALKLLETRSTDDAIETLAAYAKRADAATLPKTWDLASTPYAILRSLFHRIRKPEDIANLERMREGLRMMSFLYDRVREGHDITQNRGLFSGIDRYGRAIRRAEADYFAYLDDLEKAEKLTLKLPQTSGRGTRTVDGLVVRNPRSYLLKEWARRDRTHPSLGKGFSFVMTNFGNTRYILGVDPEAGVHLKGLGDMLNAREAAKREAEGRAFPRLWFDGNAPFFNFRIIDSPQDGTVLSHREIVETLKEFSRGCSPKR
ncbi:MAG: hypothetical protein ACE5LV_11260 [Candidatus Aminicenantales bacterium]